MGPPGSLHHFGDLRLYEYWTKYPQNETVFLDLGGDNKFRVFKNESLWTIGNK